MMNMAADELRGSAPVMSAKDVLLEVRDDVKLIGKNVDILVSQHLDERVRELEAFRSGMTGGSSRVQSVDATIRGWLQPAISVAAIIVGVLIATNR
jgi:hypothetical protein